ncbi:hypothetical protein BDQ17DRAFT_638085 [Cyathus striatus]|nr:hypothetical protein BDQ17DRAFT_638085 [Cyathus striatus]
MPTSTVLPAQGSKTDTILDYIPLSTKLLRDVGDATNVPYLKVIAGVSVMIAETIQTVKNNKQDCIKMTERAYELVCAIINVFSESEAELSPSMVRNIVQFTDTLQKLLSYVRIQAEGSIFERIRKHTEISRLLADCKEGLRSAMDNFGITSQISTSATLAQIQLEENLRHQEVMAFLESKTVKFELNTNSVWSTSTLLSLLPQEPQIFYGRDSELKQVVTALQGPDDARVPILGQGGIGKTSLALAALHHPDIVDKYTQRYFIACDSSGSVEELHSAMAMSLGIQNVRKLERAIVEFFEGKTHANNVLLVLDNFETPWEGQSRLKTEEFLSVLCGVKRLSIIITMRGTERPSGPRWTRPFLPPLQPLSFEAAKSIFVEISDEPEDSPNIAEIIQLTDSLPLAVKLLAQLASFEGSGAVLRRWKEEKDYLYTDGDDKTNNLDISIGLSLSSHRIRTQKGAKELLTAISLLPIGISDFSLKQVGMPIDGVLKCKSVLCSTALAYVDSSGKLKALTPVREYMLKVHPPTLELYDPLCRHFYEFINILYTSRGNPPKGLIQQVNSNLGNVISLLRFATLESEGDIRRETLHCVIGLALVDHFTGFETGSILALIKMDIGDLEKDEWGGWYWYALSQSRLVSYNGAIHRENLWNAVRVFEAVGHKRGIVQAYHAIALYGDTFFDDGTVGSRIDSMACVKKSIQAAEESQNPRFKATAYFALAQVWYYSGKLREALRSVQEAKEFAKVSGTLILENQCLVQEGNIYLAFGKFPRCLAMLKQATENYTALGIEDTSPVTMHKDHLLAAAYYSSQNMMNL